MVSWRGPIRIMESGVFGWLNFQPLEHFGPISTLHDAQTIDSERVTLSDSLKIISIQLKDKEHSYRTKLLSAWSIKLFLFCLLVYCWINRPPRKSIVKTEFS